MDLPIICTLTESELRERRETILNSLRSDALEVVAMSNGYSYRFSPGADILSKLSKLVELESQCCQFLTFKIIVAPPQQITLEVSGPPEAKVVIADCFGS